MLLQAANQVKRLLPCLQNTSGLERWLYDAEWVVMDEGTKRWIDHEDMCPILTISSGSASNPTPTSQSTSIPTAVQTGAESPTSDATPTDDTEENNIIEVIISVVKETINRILDLLEKLL